MEPIPIRHKIRNEINNMLKHTIVVNRRFLDDEQLIRSEQLAVLEAIFNTNVRDSEIREISSHFGPVLRGDHPVHLALWGKTGTGKTLTVRYFLGLLADMCQEKQIALRQVHLDLSIPRPCFRALNDLACLLDACKHYKKGIALEELILRIENALAHYHGYLVIFVDEVDNVRTDKDTFLSFLVRRLPQRIPGKLVLVFASNRLNWMDNLDPRTRSFLKVNELIFKPYNALDLQHILGIRVKKALRPDALDDGVLAKIAALSSRDHGDARQAVALLARSASLAERIGSKINLDLVDQAASDLERDRYVDMIRTAPTQLQATMLAVIRAFRMSKSDKQDTGTVFAIYQRFCQQTGLRPLAIRAFRDLINELDMYTFLRSRVLSKGRHGRTREIILDLPPEIARRIEEAISVNFDLPLDRHHTGPQRKLYIPP